MKMNQTRAITANFKLIKSFAAGALAFALVLLATSSAFGAAFVWTNTTGAVFNDPNAWNPVGGPGGAADSATLAFTGTLNIPLTNSFADIGNLLIGAAGGGQTLILGLDFGTNNFAGLSGNTTSASGFVFGNAGTSIVYIAVGTMYCTNAAANPSNARLIIGRNGPAVVNLTNGTLVAGNLIMANGGAASGSKLVVSGASCSSNLSVSIANNAAAFNNSVIVSNSASMTVLNGINVGSVSGSGGNSLLVDTSAKFFTRGQDPSVGNTGSSNNTATIQGGAFWDVGGRALLVGKGGGTALNNLLRIGTSSVVSNVTFVTVTAGNRLDLAGGALQVSSAVTNSGTLSGSGTIIGNTFMAGNGTVTPGSGGSVGTLTFSNSLTLVSGNTTVLDLDKSQAGSNDALNVVGTLTETGTLTINNAGPALAGGDTFQLFTAGTASGDFVTTNLPSLSGTLIWNTSSLHSGAISIILPPSIVGPGNQAVLPGSNVVISTVVTGVPVPSLQWQHEGTNLLGATSDTITIPSASTNDAGTYCLIASNTGSSVTNCMALTVCSGGCPPTVGSISDQTVIQGNTGTFSASVAGLPAPTVQWQENGTDIPGATGTSLILTNVQFSQDGFVYSIIASNVAGTATNGATLHVIIAPSISQQPTNLTVNVGQSATFSVTASGVPALNYQWQKNNNNILNATNASYHIASAQASDMANYRVVLSNTAGTLNSSNAFLTVVSTMTASLTPSNGAVNVCYDTPLYITFSEPPVATNTGTIKIYNVTNSVTPVDTINTSLGVLQSRTIGTETFNTFPIIITGSTAAIYPHLGVLSSNQTYYATVDPGTFTDTNGALYGGITDTNAWRFTTKPTGPADPFITVVATDNSADFATVQGAVDFVPNNNGIHRLINIRDGDYNELIDTRGKSNITFRGQSRNGTIVGYRNNDAQNGGTHARMAFKVFGDDISIENMTVTNRSGKINIQAEAIMIESNIKRFILNNAKVASYQDTILGNTGGTQAYFKDSLIVGDTDFIWGSMNAFFTNCEIQCQSVNSHITQARTDDNPSTSNGMSFVFCQITRPSVAVTNCDFGRTLGFSYGNVIFKHCRIDAHITGWSDLSLRDWEFDNSNLTATAAVTYNGIQLTNGDSNVVCADDPNCWLYGWAPQLAPNILSGPTNLTVTPGQSATFSVSATGLPEPLSYQWLKNGTNVVGATSATLNIPSVDGGDAGAYSVIVSNSAGSVTSSSATLTVVLNPFQTWQQQHFGCTFCSQAAAGADPDGDGLSNEAEYLAGTDPNSSASALKILSVANLGTNGQDGVIEWATSGGHTNAVQATAGELDGSYSTNGFADISGPIIIQGSGDQTTNYTDVGGATNSPSRYYRIRLVP